MAVTAELIMSAAVSETDDLGLALATVAPIEHKLRQQQTLGAGTTPAATQVWSFQGNLTGGAATIDLTLLSGKEGTTLDLTGLKVQAFLIRNVSGNTGTLTVDVGATNGYQILGSAGSEAVLAVGGALMLYSPEGLPDVGATAKSIDLSSADADATYEIVVVAG